VRGLLTALLVLAGLVSLAVGSRPISLGTVIDVLLHPDGSDASTIVHDLRTPTEVFTSTMLAETFGLEADVLPTSSASSVQLF
jgi:ABC-type Fe3+-siderophore transport system permease subunit